MSYEIPENLFDGVKVKAHKGKHIEFSFGFRQVQEARRLCTMSTT